MNHAYQKSLDSAQEAWRKSKAALPEIKVGGNYDLFSTAVGLSIKSDMASMESPIFSLATNADHKAFRWESADGKRSLTIKPGFDGRATIFDKDILIYCMSLAMKNKTAPSRTVNFAVYDFFRFTEKVNGGEAYGRFRKGLERLKGTVLITDIKTGGVRISEGFSLIDNWKVIESEDGMGATGVSVTLSAWTYNSLVGLEVLTFNKAYFKIRSALGRRLYEIARKHVGNQRTFNISIKTLHEKSGSRDRLTQFSKQLEKFVAGKVMPDYAIEFNCKDLITFKKN